MISESSREIPYSGISLFEPKIFGGKIMKENSERPMSANDKLVGEKKNEKLREFLSLVTLSVITLVMGFTPLGYINEGLIIITFMSIPVIISAAILRPRDAMVIGMVFGITSFIQAIWGTNTLTGALFRISPIWTFFLCVAPRVLVGLFGGLIFKYIHDVDRTNILSYVITSLAVPIMNTLLFTTTLYVMVNVIIYVNPEGAAVNLPTVFSSAFVGVAGNASSNIIFFFVNTMGTQAILEAVVCCVLGTIITKVLSVIFERVRNKYEKV